MFSAFTRDGILVLAQAQRLAKEYRHKYIMPEHILLGLLRVSGNQAVHVLEQLQVDVSKIEARLIAYLKLYSDSEEEKKSKPLVRRYNFSVDSMKIFIEATQEALDSKVDFVDTRLLILGMLRGESEHVAGKILQQYGITHPMFKEKAHLEEPLSDYQRIKASFWDTLRYKFPVRLSWNFWVILLFTVVSGYLAYAGIGSPSRTVFVFIVGGWLISLMVHEFGHALVAYLGGDRKLPYKGYLAFNPFRYEYPFTGVIWPFLFLLIGGISWPYGPIYIDFEELQNNVWRSAMAAAGIIATLLFTVLLSLPFIWEIHLHSGEDAFWAGMAVLILVQIAALFINLLPLPGLDGFGIIAPSRAPTTPEQALLRRSGVTLLLIFLLFLIPGTGDFFWSGVERVADMIHLNLTPLSAKGYKLFRFWKYW